MFYTVEVKRALEAWRLSKDGSWRALSQHWTAIDADVRIENAAALARYQRENMKVVIDGKDVVVNPQDFTLGSHHTVFTLHRTEPPPLPSKEQLRGVIRLGDDRYTHALVLDLNGRFALHRWGEFEINDPRIAVRMEALVSGNGYVGEEAAESGWLDNTYKDYLGLWILHLVTGRVHVFDDIGTSEDEAELLEEFRAVIKEQRWLR